MKTAAITAGVEPRAHTRFGDFVEMTKPRLNTMVMVTTAVGFYLGARTSPQAVLHGFDSLLLFHALIGTFLVAGGSAALNMLMERDADARMHRTQDRPLPAGRLTPVETLWFGNVLCATGLIYLTIAVNALTGFLAAITLVSYLFIYTPLKRRTSLCTVVGAVPGALPPMIGWAAARGEVGVGAWVLFAIMFLWQLPHFLAIAWLYKEDYARGGFPMLAVRDPDGAQTGRQVAASTMGLVLVSLVPFFVGLAGSFYFLGALALGLGFFGCGIYLARECSALAARRLFYASLLYLPLVLGLMIWDRGVL